MLNHIPKNMTVTDYHDLAYAILFHDAIYDVTAQDNEEQSAKLFHTLCYYLSTNQQMVIEHAIWSTKTGKPMSNNQVANMLNLLDRSILEETDWDKLVKYELGISKEYLYQNLNWASFQAYLKGRRAFLLKQTNPALHDLANRLDEIYANEFEG